jgi:hypothetical protein
MRATFIANSLPLGATVTLTALVAGERWLATDENNQQYVLLTADADLDLTADEVRIMDPHPLIGQRGFSFLVTGTLTVMEPNRQLALAATDDVIIRGNLNLLGAGSDLILQSDKWVYWEGEAIVNGDLTIYGGVELDGTDRSGVGSKGTSVLIPATSRLGTTGSGSRIDIRGSKDVEILGAVVAGGIVGASGVTWAGPDSEVRIQSGQQLYIDSGIQAAGSVRLIGGSAGRRRQRPCAPADHRLRCHGCGIDVHRNRQPRVAQQHRRSADDGHHRVRWHSAAAVQRERRTHRRDHHMDRQAVRTARARADRSGLDRRESGQPHGRNPRNRRNTLGKAADRSHRWPER